MSYTRIVPLGGLGEIGMNCLALETPEGIVVIDCGVTFPHDAYGIDVIHPDFSYLWDRREQVLGVVVTHGHEDHIGALPYLLRMVPVPVWAPPYAATLIKARLEEHPEVPPVDLHRTAPRQTINIGPFRIEPLRVTHSIPDSTALAIDTPAGRILHTGDFKFEPDPLDGEASDEARLRELGDDGIAVLLSDSTNVDVPARKSTERDVGRALRELISPMEGRVVVGLFASNIYRLQSIAQVAMDTGRKLSLVGRSVQTHVKAATELGRFKIPSDLLVAPEFAMGLPPRELLAIATGTQAEPSSALARIARGDHPNLRLEKGDAVLLSSRTIPGNERAVFDLICALERRGVDVHFRTTDGEIHVTGHASREEQSKMLTLARPRSFVPIHGTYHHLRRHAKLAEDTGVRDVTLLENGTTVRWDGSGLAPAGWVPHGRILVDQGFELPEQIMEERAAMASSGVVVAQIALNAKGMLTGGPVLSTRGVLLEETMDVMEGEARAALDDALRLAKGARDVLPVHEAKDASVRALRRVFRVGPRRPLVVVQIAGEVAPRSST